jgi:hypothetical protein
MSVKGSLYQFFDILLSTVGVVAAIEDPLNFHTPKPKILQVSMPGIGKRASSHPRGTLSQPVKIP